MLETACAGRSPQGQRSGASFDSKTSPAVQLADVMIGAAIEVANTLAGRRSGGPDAETVLAQYADHQFIHLVPSADFAEQRQFRQGTQAAEMIDYFAANFHSQARSKT